MENYTVFQFFHWYLPPGGRLWQHVAEEAGRLSESGITAVWLPPAFKGSDGGYSVGYNVYDLYDLGEFDQKGTVSTRYGTKDEYLNAIRVLQEKRLQVYADIVLNHKAGADEAEEVMAHKVNPDDRNEVISDDYLIKAFTKFYFPGRKEKYSSFIWDFQCFTGVDWDDIKKEKGIYKIRNEYGDSWTDLVGSEKGNFDYLMFSDIEFRNPAVMEELKKWGLWYLETTGVDGFRLDAIKHIPSWFFNEWLDYLRQETGRELFTIGEYWYGNKADILEYIEATEGRFALFDVPLHNNFHKASCDGKHYDLRKIFDGSLVQANPLLSITFVDNHDTQPLQALESPVEHWFQPLAYALILLREQGGPCVFYPALYGAEYTGKGQDGKDHEVILEPCVHLEKLLYARKDFAYGLQRDYFDHSNVIGWTREGVQDKPGSGCAVLLSNGEDGEKEMDMGSKNAGRTFVELTNSRQEKITLDETGKAVFFVNGGSVAVWIPGSE